MSLDTALLEGPYDTVLDVGAFRGDFARAARAAWPDAKIYSFEPLEPRPADFDNDPNWWWFPVALGPVQEQRVIHRSEFVPSSSFLPMMELHKTAFPYTQKHEDTEVTVRTLDQFGYLVEGEALLKLDVQGYELQVLVGGSRVLRLFRGVVLEVSWERLYAGSPSFRTLKLELAQYGFEHAGRVDEMLHPRNENRVLQSDELWLRA